jgi:hypothetical protein
MVRWKMFIRVARTHGESLGPRYLEVRYEDLTRAPEIWMRRICQFLDEPFEPAVLRSAQPYMAARAGEGSIRENSGQWRSYFPEEVARRLEQIAGRTLAECGYLSRFPDSDDTPPFWQQQLWWVTDAGRQFLQEVAMKAAGRIERSWRTILMRPINAYRQRRENRF